MNIKGNYTSEERAERVEWIVRLYEDHCIAEISRITGSCERFIKKVLLERGVKLKRTNPCKGRPRSLESQKRTETILSLIREGVFYAEIAKRLDVTLAYVSLVARSNGIRLTTKEIAKRSKTNFGTIIKAERRRLMFGLPQKTKRKININPNKYRIYELRLRMRKRGYVLDEGLMVVYYNNDTNRSTRCENTAKKYHVRVIELKQCLKCV